MTKESRPTRHFSMIRDFHLADFLTLANGVCGTAAIFLAMDHVREARADKVYAAGLLVVGALFLLLWSRTACRCTRSGTARRRPPRLTSACCPPAAG